MKMRKKKRLRRGMTRKETISRWEMTFNIERMFQKIKDMRSQEGIPLTYMRLQERIPLTDMRLQEGIPLTSNSF